MKNILFTIYIGFFCFSSCNKEPCPSLFEIPIEISPKKLEYHVGDTITLTSKFYKMVYENATKKTYDMGGIRWKPVCVIDRIDSILAYGSPLFGTNIDFIKNPKYPNFYLFNYSNGSNNLVGEYNYSNDTFDLKYRLVLKQKGTYLFLHGSSVWAGNLDNQSFEGSCRNGFDVFVKMNNGDDNNSQQLKESPDRLYNDLMFNNLDNKFNKGGGYCFKVLP